MNLIWILFSILAPLAFLCGLFTIVGLMIGNDPFYFVRKPVYLIESDGSYKKSRIHIDKNGVQWAPVYPASMIGHVVLNEGGIATGDSSWIKRWSLEEPELEGKIERLNRKYKLP